MKSQITFNIVLYERAIQSEGGRSGIFVVKFVLIKPNQIIRCGASGKTTRLLSTEKSYKFISLNEIYEDTV